MPRKKKIEEISDEEMEKLINLSAPEKLARLKYLESEIEKTKGIIKDQKASAKDYIGEMEARRKVLMSAVQEEPIPS